MSKYVLILVIAIAALSSASFAGQNKKVILEEDKYCLFRGNEIQVDAFGSGAFYKNGRPGWGGGLGLNYFFSRYIGIGVEQGLVGRNNNGSNSYTEWNTLGNLFLRYPICSWNLAPYVMVGGGAFYGTNQGIGVGHVGGGLEYRFSENVGIFSDARWMYTGEQDFDYSGAVYARAGLRFAF